MGLAGRREETIKGCGNPCDAFVGRAVGYLASNYAYLRGISQNKLSDEVAESIARAVAECVPSDIDAIKSDITKYRSQVARAFKALRCLRSATHSVRSIPAGCTRWVRVICEYVRRISAFGK